MFDSPFTSYAYAYPHKTAYRSISPAISLRDAWRNQPTSALFLYLHVPFCEFRCGFCNLFTLAQPSDQWPLQYLAALRKQAEVVRRHLPESQFARLAIGGGTPTFLQVSELAEMLSIIAETMQIDGTAIPAGIEASPGTVDLTKLRLLRDFGFDRISLGVQSFQSDDLNAIGRPQRSGVVQRAIEQIREVDFPTLNLDLIYGAEGQTLDSWMQSVRKAVQLEPEEIYLYPLYVRRLTGLAKISRLGLDSTERHHWDNQRLQLYRAARDYLVSLGYRQISMRMFASPSSSESNSPAYCCQSDGMLGLGCGARSYTDQLHYSYEYAVGANEVRKIIQDYMERDKESFAKIEFGYQLDDEDRRRRFLILSLLQSSGLNRLQYQDQFGSNPMLDFPSLKQLVTSGQLEVHPDRLQLTPTGIEFSDSIGPWLNSKRVNQLINQ